MPVDPFFLTKDRPRPRPPRRMASRAAAWLIALVGTAALGGFFAVALSDPSAAKAFVALAVALDILIFLALAIVGWNEDGLIGVWYRVRHPFGTALGADPERPPMWWAIGWVFALALALAAILIVRDPSAAAGILPGRLNINGVP